MVFKVPHKVRDYGLDFIENQEIGKLVGLMQLELKLESAHVRILNTLIVENQKYFMSKKLIYNLIRPGF